jgi:hypothetical protein
MYNCTACKKLQMQEFACGETDFYSGGVLVDVECVSSNARVGEETAFETRRAAFTDYP